MAFDFNFSAKDKVHRILGNGPQQYTNRATMVTGDNATVVARKVEQLMAGLRDVEAASGTITVKIVGQPAKQVAFRYG